MKSDVVIKHNKLEYVAEKRPVVQSSNGLHVHGAALPHCCPNDPGTMEAGLRKRFAMEPPVANRGLLRKLKNFVRSWVRKNLERLPSDADQSFERWLEHTNYPEWRKRELVEVRKSMDQGMHASAYKKVKSFMKDECYGEYKHARAINGRCDEAKVIIGPVVKLMEDVVYQHPAFIKHVPVPDRPEYIANLYSPGDKVIVTDYSSFEALFRKSLMECVEMELFKWMTSKLPNKKELLQWMRETWLGKNHCEFKHFSVKIRATRMSGEMTTSLANGFSNLMFMEFLCKQKGSTCRGVVEGDDGLFYIRGEVPTSKDFEDLGLIIKLKVIDRAEVGSFCGMIFDPADKAIICDAMKQMVKFGWCAAKYRFSSKKKTNQLLRAKALSLAYQYPGCPILNELSALGLRLTRGVKLGKLFEKERNFYIREQMAMVPKDEADIPIRSVTIATRTLYHEVFGVSVEDQLQIEDYLKSIKVIQPLNHPSIIRNCHDDWTHYWNFYVVRPHSAKIDEPMPRWDEYPGFKSEFKRKLPLHGRGS